jgi:hypothetical protein
LEHQAPAARIRDDQTSENLQSSSLMSETIAQAMQGRTTGTGGSDGAVRWTSQSLRNLRLDFGKSRRSPTMLQGFSSPAGEKQGGTIGSMDHSHSGTTIPPTALRKNITQRRSNGRARDSIGSTSGPVLELITRVPMPMRQGLSN